MNRTMRAASRLAAGLMFFASIATADTTATEVSRKATELWHSIKSYSADRQADALGHGRKLIRDMDAEIARLGGKAERAQGEAKATYERELRSLKSSRDAAAAKLDHWGRQSGAAWNEAKDGFADAYRDLHRAYDGAAAKLK